MSFYSRIYSEGTGTVQGIVRVVAQRNKEVTEPCSIGLEVAHAPFTDISLAKTRHRTSLTSMWQRCMSISQEKAINILTIIIIQSMSPHFGYIYCLSFHKQSTCTLSPTATSITGSGPGALSDCLCIFSGCGFAHPETCELQREFGCFPTTCLYNRIGQNNANKLCNSKGKDVSAQQSLLHGNPSVLLCRIRRAPSPGHVEYT